LFKQYHGIEDFLQSRQDYFLLNSAFDPLQQVIRIDPDNAGAYYFLGVIYNFRHNPIKTIEYLKKVRDSDSMEEEFLTKRDLFVLISIEML
jgi:hypothetical protein